MDEHANALAFLQQLAREVSEGSIDLPCFPDVVVRISLALADANTNADKIVIIVGAEPRLAARILQTANSAAFNTSGKILTDLRSAITRLGHQLVQSAAMAYARSCLLISRKFGASPMKVSGRCAGHASISPIPRSWSGSPSIARSNRWNSSATVDRSSIGAKSQR